MFKRFKKKLIHIVYVSFSVGKLSETELENLLFNIRGRNKKLNVTGLLLYNDESFIQLIEGEELVIKGLFEKIKKDKRHTNIVLLLEEGIKRRAFPDWSMGYFAVNKEQSKLFPGYNDFMHSDEPSGFIAKTTKKAIQLLNSFKVYT